MSSQIDEKLCPLCGEENGCKKDSSCWCHEIKIPKELLDMVDEDKRGKACICKSCVEKYLKKP